MKTKQELREMLDTLSGYSIDDLDSARTYIWKLQDIVNELVGNMPGPIGPTWSERGAGLTRTEK